MTFITRTILISILIFSIFTNSLLSQENPDRKGKVKVTYQLASFSRTAGYPPENIISMDNNLEILLFCRRGAAIKDLNAKNIKNTPSQLRLLIDWNLLLKTGDKYHTAMPFLGTEKIILLRNAIKSTAKTVIENIRDDIADYMTNLKNAGMTEYAYTFLFSYVLDELVFDEFKKSGIDVKPPLSADFPNWTGVLWALEKPRDSLMGTTSVIADNVSLRLNWNQRTGRLLNSIVQNTTILDKFMGQLKISDTAEDESVIDFFNTYNIVDTSGNLLIPVISADTDNKVYKSLTNMAIKIADHFIKNVDFSGVAKDLNISKEMQAFAISYYEFMYELMDGLERDEIITPPSVFNDAGTPNKSDAGKAVFIVRHK